MTKIPQSWEGRIKHSFIKNDNYEDMADFGKNAQLVKDVNTSFEVKSISAESISISAGAAGTTGVCAPKYRGTILNAAGTFAGKIDDTSVIITSTALTNEVAYNDSITTTAMFASMANGDFAINYYTGEIYYKKGDASISFTMDYKIPLLVSGVSVGTIQVDDIDVSAFKNEAGAQKDAKVNGADILVMQTGSGNDATAMTEEIATETTLALIEGKDFATETTLSTLDGKVTACDTTNVTVTSQPALASGTDSIDAVQSGIWDVVSNSSNIATENTLASIETEVTTELEPHYNPDADETPVELKASSGKLHYVHVYNPNAYDVRLQLFNIAAASVVLGTTPIRVPLRIPAQGYGWIDLNTKCVGFDTAMSYAITKTDNTSALDTDAEITIFYR